MRRSIHTRRVRQPTPPTSTAVSSRGCSKTYIICFLARILEHCRSLEHAPDFPFPSELVTKWLMTARQDCINKAIDAEFGGVKFNEEDPSSYWTSVSQFFTWWKNNIERRKKFRLLKMDATYCGNEMNLIKRARFCANAVVLAVNIRNHFEKNRIKQAGTLHSVAGPQYQIPFRTDSPKFEDTQPIDIETSNYPYESDGELKLSDPRIICCHHISEDDLNGVEAMMDSSDATGANREGASHPNLSLRRAEWESIKDCFNDECSEMEFQSSLLDEIPLHFDGDNLEAENMEELACVKFRRASTPIPRSQCVSTSSLVSLGTSCSSDFDDRSSSVVSSSPLPSPFLLEKSDTSELPIDVCLEDYWTENASPSERKGVAWAPISPAQHRKQKEAALPVFIPLFCRTTGKMKVVPDRHQDISVLSALEHIGLDADSASVSASTTTAEALTSRSQRVRKAPKKLLDSYRDFHDDILEI